MPETSPEEATSSENNSSDPERTTAIPIREVENGNNLNLGARTMERSRIFVNNISTRIEEMQPLIGQISCSLWPNSPRQNSEERASLVPGSRDDNIIINIESSPEADVMVNPPQNPPPRDDDHNQQHPGPIDNSQQVGETENNESQNNNNQGPFASMNPEARKVLQILRKYTPLILILLVKFINDYKAKLIHFLVLLITTVQANTDLKREISKQHNRSYMTLIGIILYILSCIVFVYYLFDQPILPKITTPTSAWDLLWILAITDFMIKLITILCKIAFTCLSARIIPLKLRGKYYLFLEVTSQLFRGFIPIPFWLNYLFEAYHGVEKIYGFGLITIYTLTKGSDIISRLKIFKYAVKKMMKPVVVGSLPTKKQIEKSGGNCTICHDKYSAPVRLSCKHIFCELCLVTWLDRERSCPLCRTPVPGNPIYRDGHTSNFIQVL